MVEITNGRITTTVTEGAFKSVFSKLGYERVNGAEPVTSVAGQHSVEESADEFADLVSKPVSQWSKHELQEFVRAKGIDTTGATTVNAVKTLVAGYVSENY